MRDLQNIVLPRFVHNLILYTCYQFLIWHDHNLLESSNLYVTHSRWLVQSYLWDGSLWEQPPASWSVRPCRGQPPTARSHLPLSLWRPPPLRAACPRCSHHLPGEHRDKRKRLRFFFFIRWLLQLSVLHQHSTHYDMSWIKKKRRTWKRSSIKHRHMWSSINSD